MIPFNPMTIGVVSSLAVAFAAILVRKRQRRERHRDCDVCKPSARIDVDVRLFLMPTEKGADEAEEKESEERSKKKTEVTVTQPTRFLIDSLLLMKSFEFVCPRHSTSPDKVNGFREEFHYTTGVRIDDRTFAVTQIVPVRYARQSASGVLVANDSNISALADLDRIGLPLVMHFHSHPGFGRESNRPSLIDRNFQERLERGGHLAIGGIFSRDGFLRFFAGDLDRFVVEVQGSNIKKVGDNEFKLDLDNERI